MVEPWYLVDLIGMNKGVDINQTKENVINKEFSEIPKSYESRNQVRETEKEGKDREDLEEINKKEAELVVLISIKDEGNHANNINMKRGIQNAPKMHVENMMKSTTEGIAGSNINVMVVLRPEELKVNTRDYTNQSLVYDPQGFLKNARTARVIKLIQQQCITPKVIIDLHDSSDLMHIDTPSDQEELSNLITASHKKSEYSLLETIPLKGVSIIPELSIPIKDSKIRAKRYRKDVTPFPPSKKSKKDKQDAPKLASSVISRARRLDTTAALYKALDELDP